MGALPLYFQRTLNPWTRASPWRSVKNSERDSSEAKCSNRQNRQFRGRTREKIKMNVHPRMMQDIEGLAHQVEPLSRRGFFMTATAATAAGYTLAAGPVSAQAITTNTTG